MRFFTRRSTQTLSRRKRATSLRHRLPLLESLEPRTMLAVTVSISDAIVTEGDQSPRFFDAFIDEANNGGLVNAHHSDFGPDGSLYVASGDSHSVLRYNGVTGAFLGEVVPSGAEGLDYPWGLTFGPDNKLYVAGRRSDNILRYDPVTQQIETFVADGNGLRGPVGVTFGADGQLYVANSGAGGSRPGGPPQVLRFAGPSGGPNGEQPGSSLGVFIPTGSGASALSNPNDLAFHGDHLYVANSNAHSIKRYDAATGAFIDIFVPAKSGGLFVPNDLYFHTDGLLYVASQLSRQVLRYNSTTGAFVDVFAPEPTAGSLLGGIASDSTGVIYVSVSIDSPGSTRIAQVLRYGPGQFAAFSVSLSEPSALPVTVTFSTSNGSAVAGTDYSATSGILTFAPGQTTRTILVKTLDDDLAEPSETFTVILSNSVGATIADGEGIGTIDDTDPLHGDIDMNGAVDADDLTIFANNFGRTSGATKLDGDIDGNGTVDADDLTVFASNFGRRVGAPLAASPPSVVISLPVESRSAELAAGLGVERREMEHASSRGARRLHSPTLDATAVDYLLEIETEAVKSRKALRKRLPA